MEDDPDFRGELQSQMLRAYAARPQPAESDAIEALSALTGRRRANLLIVLSYFRSPDIRDAILKLPPEDLTESEVLAADIVLSHYDDPDVLARRRRYAQCIEHLDVRRK